MTEIIALKPGDGLWADAAAFAQASAWRAGPYLARMMRRRAFLSWERVFLAREEGEDAGYCALLRDDELPPEHGLFPFIGFVYVEERRRGRRLSGKMIDHAVAYAGQCGFHRVYLMSGEKGLYEKYGFRPLGEYETVFGTVDQLFVKETNA